MLCRFCGGKSHNVVTYDLGIIQQNWRDHSIPTDVDIWRCETYGSYFTGALPSVEVIASQYKVDTRFTYDSPTQAAARAQRSVKRLEKFLGPSARVMDVGGGDGSFAIAAARLGYEAWLQELGSTSLDRLARAGVNSVESVRDAGAGRFDAVTLWDVFEHVWPHDDFLGPITTALKEGGTLIIEIPSPSHLVPLFLAMSYGSQSPRREILLAQICNFTHLQLLTRRELCAYLPRFGYDVVHSETYSELSYAGVEYARRVIKWKFAAEMVGNVFDHPLTRRMLLGDNKTLVVARKTASRRAAAA
jgi:2-polyprenyl-3-methyl-5-hydroxy-6-metoxy-1,4-benzoquinol methylase